AAYDQPVTMSFRTVDGTATTSDSDYVARGGTLPFNPGETTKTITVVVNGDGRKEADETFFVDLFGNSSNSLFTKSRGVGTILTDDGAPSGVAAQIPPPAGSTRRRTTAARSHGPAPRAGGSAVVGCASARPGRLPPRAPANFLPNSVRAFAERGTPL